MIDHLTCTILGQVQGIGYRYWMRQRARSAGVRGYIMNCPDGSVRFEAEGEKEKLQFVLELATFGPMGANIKSIEPRWSMVSEYSFPDDFEIRGDVPGIETTTAPKG